MSNEHAADGDVRRKSGLGQRIAYAFGNLGQAAFYNAMSTYFIVYVTSCLFSGVDKALAAKLIGVITSLVVIIRIAEIFVDPLLGNLVDNTNTKWGRFRPWQFFGGLVSSVLLAVVFSGMFGLVNVNSTLFIVLFVITFIVLDVFYSLRDISYWGMIPALSSDSHERSTYTALGSFTGSIGGNAITILVIPVVTYFSWVFTGENAEHQSGWTAFGIIVAVLGIMTAWTVAFGTRENQSALRANAEDNGGPLQAFKAVFQNDQLLWVALSYLLYAIANVTTTGVLLFLFKFVLDNQAAFSATGVIAMIAGLVMSPMYPILNRYIPRRYLYIGGMVSMIVAYVMLALFSSNIVLVFIALVLFYVPGTLIMMTVILSLTDSIEYGQLKNGKRNEAVTLSIRPMLDKIGGALSNGIVGFIALAAGMTGDATAADMTPTNIHVFKICAFYAPLILIVLSLLVFVSKVKITEKMHAQIVDELEAKLASGEIVDDEAQTVEAAATAATAATAGDEAQAGRN
ncbi:glycoside-pentoside-hexuronide (GPH):cation symporter [Bifidobacterium longum]|uniref:glycoside-pentoside-hexuronide (GPH):cation symporter n=1 Tax=Bifidobacterium longum TaxID=216816 RepID=UPI0008F943FD|nr:glycoside-pentoside-hexuronide (GPH):cation symporter [Bifidobacterium longum]OIN61749.1 MFS transporter [Bifidobacterium longum subsp. infantis]